MLQIITSTPNKRKDVFFGSLPASFAAIGAATTRLLLKQGSFASIIPSNVKGMRPGYKTLLN